MKLRGEVLTQRIILKRDREVQLARCPPWPWRGEQFVHDEKPMGMFAERLEYLDSAQRPNAATAFSAMLLLNGKFTRLFLPALDARHEVSEAK